jgi:hypothetical protein
MKKIKGFINIIRVSGFEAPAGRVRINAPKARNYSRISVNFRPEIQKDFSKEKLHGK